jgi:hypothetical protein
MKLTDLLGQKTKVVDKFGERGTFITINGKLARLRLDSGSVVELGFFDFAMEDSGVDQLKNAVGRAIGEGVMFV